MNERQKVNKIIHTYVDVNKHEDYTDYKGLITSLIEWKNEQLRIANVSQQRELLEAFAKHQRDWGNTPLSKEMHEKEVEHFLKANNCG